MTLQEAAQKLSDAGVPVFVVRCEIWKHGVNRTPQLQYTVCDVGLEIKRFEGDELEPLVDQCIESWQRGCVEEKKFYASYGA